MQKPPRRSEDHLLYKGAVLKVKKLRKGWRVFVTLPGADIRECIAPTTFDDAAREDVIDQAKTLVHRHSDF